MILRRVHQILLGLFIISSVAGCSGSTKVSSQGQGTGGTTADPYQSAGGDITEQGEENGGGNTEGSPTVETRYSHEELRSLYDSIPVLSLTTVDKINRDRVFGFITEEEAGRQKIRHYFNHTCLNEGYRAEEKIEPCGTSLVDEINNLIDRFPELKIFLDALKNEQSTNTERNPPPSSGLQKAQLPLPPLAITTLEAYSSTIGSGVFANLPVANLDSHTNLYSAMNQKKTVTYGGRNFDIYYEDTPSSQTALGAVEACVQNSEMWSLANKVFYPGIKPEPWPGHQNYSIFLIDTPVLTDGDGGSALGITYGRMNARNEQNGIESYMVLEVIERTEKEASIRGQHTIPKREIQLGVCTHEMYHALSASFFGDRRRFWNFAVETLPEWFAEQALPGSNHNARVHFPSFLGTLHRPLDFFIPQLKQYGAALFWDYLSCLDSDPSIPVKEFHTCIKNGTDEHDCMENVLRIGNRAPSEVVLGFGESALNFKNPPLEIKDLRTCLNGYHDFFHPLILDNGRYSLPDTPTILHPIYSGMYPKTVFRARVDDYSLKYFVFLGSGNTVNNFYKVDVSNICQEATMACSIFMIKVDKVDRSKFEVVHHERVPRSTGMIEYTAAQTDSEPDIMILVMANGEFSSEDLRREGDVSIDTKMFDGSSHFEIERALSWVSPLADGSFENSRVRIEGNLEDPGLPVKKVPIDPNTPEGWPYHWFDMYMWDIGDTRDYYVLGALTTSIEPLKSGTLNWMVERRDPIQNGCPARNRSQFITQAQGTRTLDFAEHDIVSLIFLPQTTGSGNVPDSFSFNFRYHDPELRADFTTQEVCVQPGCCPHPEDLDPRASFDDEGNFDVGHIQGDGTIEDGATTLTITRRDSDTSDWSVEGTITLPQPIEIPFNYDRPGYTHGEVFNIQQGNALFQQLVPPVIDFHRPNPP